MRTASRNAAPLRSVPDKWCFATDASARNHFARNKKTGEIADHHCKNRIGRKFLGVRQPGVITPR
jgi:hypothetical protein